MEKRRIAILGSTGSIGRQALDVISQHPDLFEVELLTANNNDSLLIEQAIKFNANSVVICNEDKYEAVAEALQPHCIKVFAGMDSVCGLLMTKRGDERVVSDILTDMEHVFPDRRSYKANDEDAAAFTKSAVLGSHKAVNFKNGRLLMEEGVGIFAVCYGKDTETALEIGILS